MLRECAHNDELVLAIITNSTYDRIDCTEEWPGRGGTDSSFGITTPRPAYKLYWWPWRTRLWRLSASHLDYKVGPYDVRQRRIFLATEKSTCIMKWNERNSGQRIKIYVQLLGLIVKGILTAQSMVVPHHHPSGQEDTLEPSSQLLLYLTTCYLSYCRLDL